MTELWQVGIVHASITDLTDPRALKAAEITWLPDTGAFRFNADPFCLCHDEGCTVFVEAYDYRVKLGEIHYYTYDAAWRLIAQGVALRTPFHLSYPFLIRDGGEIYMLPEAHRSGKLTLYRAERFPDRWAPVATLLDIPAIDASVIRYQDRWWMFYALPGKDQRAFRELHIAWADKLTGPWYGHAANPVRVGADASRPGGTPFVRDGVLYMPMQDCRTGYGTQLNLLRIDRLTSDQFTAEIVSTLSPDGIHTDYPDGLHTLSGDGVVALIDVKRNDRTSPRGWVDLQRRIRKPLTQMWRQIFTA